MRLYIPGPAELIVSDVIAAYLSHITERVAKGSYDAERAASLRSELNLFAVANAKPVAECRQRDLACFLADHPAWKSIHTRRRVIGGVIACFRWAADEERGDLIDVCPYKSPHSLAGEPYKSRRPAEHAEYVSLMRSASRPLRRALFFLRRTGARTCEMRELTWPDVRIDGPHPHVCLYRHKTHRKTGKPRKIGLDPATAHWLRCLRRQSDRAYVFLNCHGTPWDRHTFARHMRRWCERLGLDDGVAERVSAYCLRHTYVCDGIEAGETTRRIADQLGHTTTIMIDRVYGAKTREREEHLADVATSMQAGRRRKVSPDSTR